MGPVGAGAACCCAIIDAPRITTALATRAPTALFMFLTSRGWPETRPAESTPEPLACFRPTCTLKNVRSPFGWAAVDWVVAGYATWVAGLVLVRAESVPLAPYIAVAHATLVIAMA